MYSLWTLNGSISLSGAASDTCVWFFILFAIDDFEEYQIILSREKFEYQGY